MPQMPLDCGQSVSKKLSCCVIAVNSAVKGGRCDEFNVIVSVVRTPDHDEAEVCEPYVTEM